ncbi:transposase [Streptomyces sp. NBC_00285]|uniref:transposase n=1 Tax=Streptomyces sp. NBC_00285 TaxID=2975700 RepID=UPI003FA70DE1
MSLRKEPKPSSRPYTRPPYDASSPSARHRSAPSLKGVSYHHLRAECTGRINRIGTGSVFWSPSCFAGSCGGAPLSIVHDYIESQKRPA